MYFLIDIFTLMNVFAMPMAVYSSYPSNRNKEGLKFTENMAVLLEN